MQVSRVQGQGKRQESPLVIQEVNPNLDTL